MTSRDEARDRMTGPVTSIHTPFLHDGEIDYDNLRGLIDRGISGGSTTMLLTYGDSLYSILTDDEVAEVTKVVAEHTAGRALVVAADRQWWTGKEIEFARYARGVGADVLMVLPPNWAASCTEQTFVDHYSAVSEEIPVMVVTNVFNTSPATGLQVLERLRDEVEGVVAVKDDLGGRFVNQMSILVHPTLAVVSGGQKKNHFDQVEYGCDGYLSTFVTFAPQVTQTYWRAVQEKDWEQALAIVTKYDMPYFDHIIAMTGGFDAGVYASYELFGLTGRWRRPPYHTATDEQVEALSALLTSLDLL